MFTELTMNDVYIFGVPLPLGLESEAQMSHWLPATLDKASQKRKGEFLAGRYCAQKAAQMSGFDLKSLPIGEKREPLWPREMKGSITHSNKLAVSCVSLSEAYRSVGIDAEELISSHMNREFLSTIGTAEEFSLLKNVDPQLGLTILFSAKEALYKALFPLTKVFIDFKEVELEAIDFSGQRFDLNLISQNPDLTDYLGSYSGKYTIMDETVISLVSIPAKGRK